VIGKEQRGYDERVSRNIESNVRYYPQVFPDVFDRAEGSLMYSRSGRAYLDFYAGSSSLNYGHNAPELTRALIGYIESGGIVTAMDLDTSIRRAFMQRFEEVILRPRGLNYRVMSPGPAGTNGVEAALMLARKASERTNIFAFHGAYHGMSGGSLSATGDLSLRERAPLSTSVTFFPFDNGYASGMNSLEYMEAVLNDPKSGIEPPAGVIVETVQAEAGVYVASNEWLQGLATLCRRHDILLIIDDVQVGIGRTGPFFSFERCGIVPDIVVLSKSLSGIGLPLTLVLFKSDLDVWQPGEYKGTFRGIQPAFATATVALDYWRDDRLQRSVLEKGGVIESALGEIAERHPSTFCVRGVGMIWGLCAVSQPESRLIQRIAQRSFARGLLVESTGRRDSVLKCTPALTIPLEHLRDGLAILEQSVSEAVAGLVDESVA
jgi:diaminobutyrate-2-oxoglutarate transaminase